MFISLLSKRTQFRYQAPSAITVHNTYITPLVFTFERKRNSVSDIKKMQFFTPPPPPYIHNSRKEGNCHIGPRSDIRSIPYTNITFITCILNLPFNTVYDANLHQHFALEILFESPRHLVLLAGAVNILLLKVYNKIIE